MLEVVGAIIYNEDGKLLICQRNKNKSLGLLWEFPGGKIEEGESVFDAIKREILEELDITISTSEVVGNTIHHYDNFSVHLTFIECKIVDGTLVKKEHEDVKWIDTLDLVNYEFCPADVEMVNKILNK